MLNAGVLFPENYVTKKMSATGGHNGVLPTLNSHLLRRSFGNFEQSSSVK